MADFEWDLWARTNRRVEQQKQSHLEARLFLAREEAGRLCGQLVAVDLGIRRIILFGSVARSESFDIDLAVEGAQHFGALFAVADKSPFDVDLLEWEQLKPRIQENVTREGVCLYESH